MDALKSALEQFSLPEPGREFRRVLHGRGHCYPGLEHVVVDWVPPGLLLLLYRPADKAIVDAFIEQVGRIPWLEAAAIQHRYMRGAPFEPVLGELPEQTVICEDGLCYEVVLGRNQNIGFFPDMINGRRWVRTHAGGKRVLNLFAYTCAFSVSALAGDAASVTNLDMSRAALERGRRNHQLNGQDLRKVRFLAHDLFRSWARLRQLAPFDLIIVDPPSYQKGSFDAAKDYPRVIRRLPELLAPGGEVLLALNDPATGAGFLLDAVEKEAPVLEFSGRLDHPEDFPEAEPERGLKVLLFTLRSGS